MGVDAGIFAKNSKKYYWFDRAYNAHGWMYVDSFYDKHPEESDRAEKIYDAMFNPDNCNTHVNAEDAIFLFELSQKAWLTSEEDDQHRADYCGQVILFVKLYPSDSFSLKSDHGGEWPECMDTHEQIEDFDLPCDHHWFHYEGDHFEKCKKCEAYQIAGRER